MEYSEIAASCSLDAIFIYNEDSKCILYSNRALSKILGYTAKEVINKDLDYMLEKSSSKESSLRIQKGLKKGIAFKLELLLKRKSTETIWVESHFTPIYDETESLKNWCIVFHPAEERKKYQDTLLRIKDQLNIVIENAPLTIWMIDGSGSIKLAEGKWLSHFQYSEEELTGKSIYDVFSDYPTFIKKIKKALLGESTCSLDFINSSYLETYFEKLKDNAGKTIGLIGVSIDVSERIKGEETRNRLNSILEGTSDFISLDDGCNLMYLNPAGKSLIGRSLSKKLPLSEIYPRWAYEKIIKEGVPLAIQRGLWAGECALRHKSGVEIPASLVMIAHKDDAGKIKYFSTIARDIRDLKENEKRLLAAKEKAEAATKAKSEFLANMSHEIRTPLNGILGFTEILSNNLSKPENIKYTKNIATSGRTLLKLINDILDLSKIESGKTELQLEPTDPSDVIDEIRTLFSLEAEKKGLDFVIETELKNELVIADSVRLRQILFNLTGNAIKYTPKGYVKIIAKEKNNNSDTKTLLFEVEDSGPGIRVKDQKEIFDSFIQRHDKSGGAGLGLAITNKLAKAMGGKISLKSQYGKGSIFTAEFSNVKISGPSERTCTKILTDPSNVDFCGSKVLIVEDMKLNLELYRIYLSNCSANIIEARNGQQALEVLEHEKPDVIIMDLKMPEMNGFETTKLIRANSKTKDIPIITITGQILDNEKKRMSELGGNAFLSKPITKDALINVLKKYLPHNESRGVKRENKKLRTLSNNELEQIYKKLSEDFLQEYNKVSNGCIFKEVKDFGRRLSKFNNAYRDKSLEEYTQSLIEAANNYDQTSLVKTLYRYPALLNKLKEQLLSVQ